MKIISNLQLNFHLHYHLLILLSLEVYCSNREQNLKSTNMPTNNHLILLDKDVQELFDNQLKILEPIILLEIKILLNYLPTFECKFNEFLKTLRQNHLHEYG